MNDQEAPSNPQRSLATRMLEDVSASPEWEAPIWNPRAQLQPLVMVIDDSPTVRSVVESCLSRAGISTVAFASGPEAITALGRGEIAPPKVLLLDVGMPPMSGYDVAKKLKSNVAFRDTRIFMLTAHDGMLDRAHARILGAGFISKPFQTYELLKTVCEALGMRVPENRWR